MIVVVDREGKVQAVREGFHASDEADLRQQVARLLADYGQIRDRSAVH